jgi:hypothetical protein
MFNETAAEFLSVDFPFDGGLGVLVLADGHAPELTFVFEDTV